MIKVPCRIAEQITKDNKAYKVLITFTRIQTSSGSSDDSGSGSGGNPSIDDGDTDEPLVGLSSTNDGEDDNTVDDEEIVVDDDDDEEELAEDRSPIDPSTNKFFVIESDIWQGGLKIEESVSSGTGFELGACIVNKMTVTLNNLYGRFNGINFKDFEAFVEIGFDRNLGIPRGYYIVKDVKLNGALINLTCYDYMCKFDEKFVDWNPNYPISPVDVIDAVCRQLNIECDKTPIYRNASDWFEITDPEIYKCYADENTTCRQMISWALEALGCYGKMSNDSKKFCVRSIIDKVSTPDYYATHTSNNSVFSGTSTITSKEAEQYDTDLGFYYNHQARTVDRYGLSGFDHLSRLSLPNVRKILDFGISYDTSLVSLYLPNARIIESGAFCYDTYLSYVRFDNVEELHYYAFTGCTNLKCVYIYSNEVCEAGEDIFYSCSNFVSGGSGRIYVPENLVEAYKTAPNWEQYASLIVAGQNAESQVHDPVYNNKGLPDYDSMYEKSNSQNADVYAVYASNINILPRKITQIRIIASGYGLILDEPEPNHGFQYISKEKFEAHQEEYAEEIMSDEMVEQGARKYYFNEVVERALAKGYVYKEIPIIAGEEDELNGLIINIQGNPFFTFDAVESGIADTLLDFLTVNSTYRYPVETDYHRYFYYGEITHGSNPTMEAGDIINVYTNENVYRMYASKTVFSTGTQQTTASIIFNDDGNGDVIPSSHNSYYNKSDVNSMFSNVKDNIWTGTSEAFEAIPYIDDNVIYYVYEEDEMESEGN